MSVMSDRDLLWQEACEDHDNEEMTTEQLREIAELLFSGDQLATILEEIAVLEECCV